MKHLLFLCALLLAGCAAPDPMLTGKPQDWKGRQSSELLSVMGQPTRVIHQSAMVEIWEYKKVGEFVAPKQNNTSFNMGGMSTKSGSFGGFGASGGWGTTERGERLSTYENLLRFKVKAGKIVGWSAARFVDGAVVWSDH